VKAKKPAGRQKIPRRKMVGQMCLGEKAQMSALARLKMHFTLPVIIVILFCLIFAVQIGALQPDINFQKTSMALDGNRGNENAYASSGNLLFKLPHRANLSASADFDGIGRATSLSYWAYGVGMNVTRIEVDGAVACSPCTSGKDYPIDASGRMAIGISAQEVPVEIGESNAILRRAFFEKNVKTNIDTPIMVSVRGSWSASANSAVPSSFYGIDAPFHIHRVPIAASHILKLQWPWSEYTYVSVVPASAIYAVLGVSYQYSYKLWEIALFFLPVALFYVFSRKLSRGKDAVFLFASLLYIFMPTQGMVTGGGADLFMYGMTAHTLATTLSLFSLLFSYEFAVERKNGRFWPAALLFALAIACNPRILLSLAIGMGAIFAFSLVLSSPKRAVLLGIACAALAAVLVAPFLIGIQGLTGSYAALGGANFESLAWSVVGFFQLGYFVLPLLFITAIAGAVKKKEMFLLFLFADCALVFVIANSPEINRMAPFLDGIRFMPSFFLPVFFLSGVGAFFAYEWLVAQWSQRVAGRFRLDRLDATVSFMLVIVLPLSALFISSAFSAAEQYSAEASSLAVAAEYTELKTAYSMVGDGCVVLAGRTDISHYPIFDQGFERTYLYETAQQQGIAGFASTMRCKYVLFGNLKWVTDENSSARWQEYEEIAKDPRFAEIAYGGSNRLFMIKNDNAAARVESFGARLDSYSFDYDRGAVRGECLGCSCSLRIRNDWMPPSVQCSGIPDCKIRRDEPNALWIDNVPQGEFEVLLEPEPADWFYPMATACAAVAIACGYAAGRMKD